MIKMNSSGPYIIVDLIYQYTRDLGVKLKNYIIIRTHTRVQSKHGSFSVSIVVQESCAGSERITEQSFFRCLP